MQRRARSRARPRSTRIAPGVAERGEDAADEPAAADRDDDRVGVGRVLFDLEADGAGAGEHDRVVEGMDERAPGLLRPARARRSKASAGPSASRSTVGAVAARRGDLLLGGAAPHHDERVDAVLGRGVGDRLGVVSGRDRDHAARSLRARRGSRACSIAPRDLNEPVRWKSSHLRRAPSVREGRSGVRAQVAARRRACARGRRHG